MIIDKRTLIIIAMISPTACGGGGGGGSTPPQLPVPVPTPNQAIGGLWTGVDSNGLEILGLSTENGRTHWIAPATGEQGFGTGSTNGDNVSFSYTYVAPIGFTLSDGSKFATCSASGSIIERQSLALTSSCTSDAGTTFNTSAALSYNSLYDRDSSLSLLAGNYDDFGVVVNVSSNGEIFAQDPSTGCITNGLVTILDASFNAYDVSYTISNCTGSNSILNGAMFSGLGVLDDTVSPETAVIGVTGQVGSVTYSQVLFLPRI